MEIFGDLLNQLVMAYIVTILICTRVQHIQHVKIVFSKLQAYQLYIKAEICEVHATSTMLLGYYISHQGVEMNQDKILANTESQSP